jgi:two-component system, NtrC family, response regulator HydG
LRVLQEGSFERLGSNSAVQVDVRVIAATNRDLEDEIRAGNFREDLFYRLNVVRIEIPPLRHRREDIPLLAEHFLQRFRQRDGRGVRGIAREAMEAMVAYPWPGNVRELENVIEHAMVFAEGEELAVADLPPAVSGTARSGASGDPLPTLDGDRGLPELLDELERQLIVRAFKQANGVKTETARLLGVKASALYYKLEKYGIDESILA